MKMCGLAGFSLSPNDKVNAKRLAKAMLLSIESRGKDATGFAFLDSTGKLQIHKRPLPASTFVKGRLCMPKQARTVIMHTRMATQGAPENNDNNHPIWQAGIAGVHNGWVHNDDSMFRRIEEVAGGNVRIAEVDSEAIFAALGYLNEGVTDVLTQFTGNVAVAWLDQGDEIANRLHLARVDTSPMVLLTTKGGSLLFASTEAAVKAGAGAVGLEIDTITAIAEGQYIQVLDGQLLKVEKFEVPTRYSSWQNYSYGKVTDNRSRSFDNRRTNWDWDDDYGTGGVMGHRPSGKVFDLHEYMAEAKAKRDAAADAALAELSRDAGESLDAKILREEADDSLSPDEDDELYQRWLAENAREIDYILDKEESDAEFTEYLRSPRINSYMIAHADYAVKTPSESEYLADNNNENREWEIERWMAGCKGDGSTKEQAGRAMKADLRPGALVKTVFDGLSYEGHVVTVPRTFPEGEYVLRLFAACPKNWKNKAYNTEAFLVTRQYWQFERLEEKTKAITVYNTEEVTQ